MSLFGFAFRPRKSQSAKQAKDRLQILLAHERGSGSEAPDYLPQLQADLLEVIRKYVKIGDDDVDIRVEKNDGISSLEINIEMPTGKDAKAEAAKTEAAKSGKAEAKEPEKAKPAEK